MSCSYCGISFTKYHPSGPRMQCLVCHDLALCLSCYESGVCLRRHEPTHPMYPRMINTDFSTEDGWTVDEELDFVEAQLIYGPNNYSVLQRKVPQRSTTDVKHHVKRYYRPGMPFHYDSVRPSIDRLLGPLNKRRVAESYELDDSAWHFNLDTPILPEVIPRSRGMPPLAARLEAEAEASDLQAQQTAAQQQQQYEAQMREWYKKAAEARVQQLRGDTAFLVERGTHAQTPRATTPTPRPHSRGGSPEPHAIDGAEMTEAEATRLAGPPPHQPPAVPPRTKRDLMQQDIRRQHEQAAARSELERLTEVYGFFPDYMPLRGDFASSEHANEAEKILAQTQMRDPTAYIPLSADDVTELSCIVLGPVATVRNQLRNIRMGAAAGHLLQAIAVVEEVEAKRRSGVDMAAFQYMVPLESSARAELVPVSFSTNTQIWASGTLGHATPEECAESGACVSKDVAQNALQSGALKACDTAPIQQLTLKAAQSYFILLKQRIHRKHLLLSLGLLSEPLWRPAFDSGARDGESNSTLTSGDREEALLAMSGQPQSQRSLMSVAGASGYYVPVDSSGILLSPELQKTFGDMRPLLQDSPYLLPDNEKLLIQCARAFNNPHDLQRFFWQMREERMLRREITLLQDWCSHGVHTLQEGRVYQQKRTQRVNDISTRIRDFPDLVDMELLRRYGLMDLHRRAPPKRIQVAAKQPTPPTTFTSLGTSLYSRKNQVPSSRFTPSMLTAKQPSEPINKDLFSLRMQASEEDSESFELSE